MAPVATEIRASHFFFLRVSLRLCSSFSVYISRAPFLTARSHSASRFSSAYPPLLWLSQPGISFFDSRAAILRLSWKWFFRSFNRIPPPLTSPPPPPPPPRIHIEVSYDTFSSSPGPPPPFRAPPVRSPFPFPVPNRTGTLSWGAVMQPVPRPLLRRIFFPLASFQRAQLGSLKKGNFRFLSGFQIKHFFDRFSPAFVLSPKV